MEPKPMHAWRGVQGNTANLLLDAEGGPTGSDCKSDTLNLARAYWVRCNVAGTLKVVMAGDDTNAVTVTMPASVASEFLVKRIFSSVTTVPAADLVLLY